MRTRVRLPKPRPSLRAKNLFPPTAARALPPSKVEEPKVETPKKQAPTLHWLECLVVPFAVWAQIQEWALCAAGEVGGIMRAVPDGNAVYVTECLLTPQTASGIDFELDAAAPELLAALSEGGPYQGLWHSHVDMNCFASGTDRRAAAELADSTWSVGLVVNKRLERYAYYVARAGGAYTYTELAVVLQPSPVARQRVAACVKPPVVAPWVWNPKLGIPQPKATFDGFELLPKSLHEREESWSSLAPAPLAHEFVKS